MMSTTGRRPPIAAPTAAPTKPASEMGQSMTRSGPNSSARPRVGPITPMRHVLAPDHDARILAHALCDRVRECRCEPLRVRRRVDAAHAKTSAKARSIGGLGLRLRRLERGGDQRALLGLDGRAELVCVEAGVRACASSSRSIGSAVLDRLAVGPRVALLALVVSAPAVGPALEERRAAAARARAPLPRAAARFTATTSSPSTALAGSAEGRGTRSDALTGGDCIRRA